MGRITLVIGGARSGKSAWALDRGEKAAIQPKIFIATAEPIDDEMRMRAEMHRKNRGDSWQTIEEPCDLPGVIQNLEDDCLALIDCCTVWLGNIWHKYGDDDMTLSRHVEALCVALEQWRSRATGEIIIVSNEVGWGIVPHELAVRHYRDWAGRLNQRIASLAQEVYLCVAGISMKIKNTEGDGL
jgi:adenosylcobinamide kinase/adenosylcobinamide-phosphate guanylyltransferase